MGISFFTSKLGRVFDALNAGLERVRQVEVKLARGMRFPLRADLTLTSLWRHRSLHLRSSKVVCISVGRWSSCGKS